MKIGKKYNIFILIIAAQCTIEGIFDYHEFKGLFSIFNEKNTILSPVEGAYLCETQQLEDFYNTEDPNQKKLPEYALMHEFFNVLEIGGIRENFRIGQKAQNWAKGLNGSLVGEIVGHLQKSTLEENKKKLAMRWKTQCLALNSTVKLTIANCYKMLDLIQASYNDDKLFTVGILTAVLYLKQSIKKQEMIDYLIILQSILGNSIFTEPLTTKIESDLLTQTYSDSELLASANINSEKAFFDSYFQGSKGEELEKIIAIGHVGMSEKIYPAKVLLGTYGFKGQAPEPNCADGALNDLLNILCYDTSTNKFNINLLPKGVQESLNEALKKFYATCYDPQKAATHEYQQAFFNIVSNIHGVKYYKGKNYAIEPSVQNMLDVVNFLLGTHAATWEALGTLLSTSQRKITCVIIIATDKISKVVITIHHNNSTDDVIVLNIQKEHASLDYAMREIAKKRNTIGDRGTLEIIKKTRESKHTIITKSENIITNAPVAALEQPVIQHVQTLKPEFLTETVPVTVQASSAEHKGTSLITHTTGHKKVAAIIKATYGSGNEFIDVTHIVKKMVGHPFYEFTGGSHSMNAFFGDPTPGIVKNLIIEVIYNDGTSGSLIIQEDDPFTLSYGSEISASPIHKKMIRIVKATYGFEGTFTDVTNTISEMLKKSPYEFASEKKSMNEMFGDPIPGTVKYLTIEVAYNDGTFETLKIRENDNFTLL